MGPCGLVFCSTCLSGHTFCFWSFCCNRKLDLLFTSMCVKQLSVRKGHHSTVTCVTVCVCGRVCIAPCRILLRFCGVTGVPTVSIEGLCWPVLTLCLLFCREESFRSLFLTGWYVFGRWLIGLLIFSWYCIFYTEMATMSSPFLLSWFVFVTVSCCYSSGLFHLFCHFFYNSLNDGLMYKVFVVSHSTEFTT